MRTTLTLDDDVAALLKKAAARRKSRLRQVVNDALRLGLTGLDSPPSREKPFRTREVSVGRCLVGSIDNISEVLAIVEGESHK